MRWRAIHGQPTNPVAAARLNSSGSLLYVPYANWVDVIDVAHASLRMCFALTQRMSSTAGPIAVDEAGRTIFLITNNGFTVVDLGAAPLSIGSVGQQAAGTGSQIALLGSGFGAQTTAKLGSASTAVKYTDQNTPILIVPAIAAGPCDLVLTRSDGAAYTLENAILVR